MKSEHVALSAEHRARLGTLIAQSASLARLAAAVGTRVDTMQDAATGGFFLASTVARLTAAIDVEWERTGAAA